LNNDYVRTLLGIVTEDRNCQRLFAQRLYWCDLHSVWTSVPILFKCLCVMFPMLMLNLLTMTEDYVCSRIADPKNVLNKFLSNRPNSRSQETTHCLDSFYVYVNSHHLGFTHF